jgi:hypothetical protein
MPLVLNDRVQQIATANTTVSFTLGSSVTGFQSFAVIGNGNTTYYSAFDSSGNWEVGLGTYATIGPTLTRNSIFSSSNSNAAVTFIGNVNVFVTYPASKSVYGDGTTLVSPSGTILPVVSGGTGVTTSTGTGSVVLSASPTLTGTVLIGSSSGTSTVTLGRSSNTSTVNINTGSSTLIATRTVNIATNGSGTDIVNIGRITASDGETTINIGTQVRSNNQTYVNINTGAIGGNAYTTIGSDDGGSLTQINGPFYVSGDSNYQVLLGSTTSTGNIILGQSTVSQTTSIQTGATASGSTKTINIGTNGLAGSTTAITVGATTGTSVTANGTWTYSTPLAATNMVQATTSTSGYLSSTDWNTFNSKGSGSVTSVTATSPVTSTGGVTPIIAMPAATTTVDGYLTSTDWNTFNSKGSGSVTSVGGTGSVNGVTLTGTVTTSGNLTLGGTLSGIGNSQLTNSSITINGTAVSLGGSVTTPSGTVTSVGGTGTVSGISLSGTVTSSGSLTLGGALDLSSPPTIGNTTPNTGAFTSVTTPSVTATTTDLTLSAISTGAVKFNTLGGLQAQVSNTASAVNYVQVTGSATGSHPVISSQGSDANVNVNLTPKGTGTVLITRAGLVSSPSLTIGQANNGLYGLGTGEIGVVGSGWEQFRFGNTASALNFLRVNGSPTANAPILSSQGNDTNISMAFQPKGTGAINLAAGSSGVNISNGGTVTAITRTATGSGYTSVPSVAITAPTTAGGVQATASANMFVFTVTVASGGTGYTVGDILSLVGGTGAAGQVTVATVSGGVITGITNGPSNGLYSALPTTPAATTGGTGSGATINITGYGVSNFTITAAGSGYIEQPTVTFSGGGGSGAAAYATVGSGTTFKTIGSTMLLQTPGGTAFGVTDIANAVNYIRNQGSATGNQVFSTVQGTDTNIAYGLTSKGTGGINFFTNLGNNLQLAVAHTASAVNYVQVTGATTTNAPVISSQGSDTNLGMLYYSKGFGSHQFRGYNGSNIYGQFFANQASPVNYIEFGASSSGNAVLVRTAGADTNIDLSLTSKGTGGILGSINSGTFSITRDSTNNAIKFTATNAANLYLQSTGGGVILFNTADSLLTQVRIAHTASAVNYVQMTGAVTGSGALISAQGSDTNIDLALTPKGTGNVRFGAYTGTILTPTGFIEIKDSGGTVRRLLVG